MAFFALSAVILYLFYNALKPKRILPIYQPSMVNTELVDTTVQYIRKYHSIPDFSLVNQLGDTITQDTFKDKIYIADFFFTTCLTICPIMTGHMGEIQEVLKDQEDVLLLSHSVTPVRDSVPVLYQYGIEKGVNPKNGTWLPDPKRHL